MPLISSLGNLFTPKRPTPKTSPPTKQPRKIPPQKLAKFHDLLSYAEIDRAKLAADLQSRRPHDPNTPVIETTRNACEHLSQRIRHEARSEQDLEGFNQLLSFFESIPRSLKNLEVGKIGCPSRAQFCQALKTIADSPVNDLNQLKISLNLHRMAYGIPSLPPTRKYC